MGAWRRRAVTLLVVVAGLELGGAALLGLGRDAAARPGGGHSYSGGSRSSSSFGGSSRSSSSSSSFGSSSFGSSSSSYGDSEGGELGPFGSVLALLVFGGVVVGHGAALARGVISSISSDWTSGATSIPDVPLEFAPRPPPTRPRPVVLPVLDPNFSEVVFGDFAYELYTRAIQARASAEEMHALTPYLTPEVRQRLRARGGRAPRAVEGVVIGGMRLGRHETVGPFDRLSVTFESNYVDTVRGRSDAALSFYAEETWTFSRRKGVQSREPHRARAFNCPSCGAPVAKSEHDACQYCGVKHAVADHDWMVRAVSVTREELRGPKLTGYAPEVGTNDATVSQEDVAARFAELCADDPELSEERLDARARAIFEGLNAAWTSLQWDDARPLLSDRLWNSTRYWISAYEQQNLQNLLLSGRVSKIEVVKVTRDRFYDAVTIRLFASVIDQVIHRETGALVGGSEEPRRYSEYWTLIRARPDAAPPRGRDCPSCGAPLTITMAGNCERCGVKVTAGARDWVLSTIQQDESYAG